MNKEKIFQGISISEGIAIGNPFFFLDEQENISATSIKESQIEKEIIRYRKAIKNSYLDIEKLKQKFVQGPKVIIDILNSHIEMLKDPLITLDVEMKIKKLKKNSEAALNLVVTEYKKSIKDPFFQERIKDIIDVKKRILNHLCLINIKKTSTITENTVILSNDLIPSDIVDSDCNKIAAFVTSTGASASHSAIIARAKNIPLISKIDINALKSLVIDKIIVDAISGKIIVNPTEKTLLKYQKLNNKKPKDKIIKKNKDIKLYANISNDEDIDKYDIDGIGLFRTEYLLSSKKEVLDEEKQFKIYRKLAEKVSGKPLKIRLFDIGGDKNFLSEDLDKNSILSLRGIRFLLKNKSVLHSQLRAIIRASDYGNIHIVVPMVSDIKEIDEVKSFIEQIKKELNCKNKIPLGCMIEVPASALLSDIFAKELDFLSIGTNDLTQYTLAIDRNLSDSFDPLHPSILKLIKMIIKSAKQYNKPVILCGELASNEEYMNILIDLGIKEFSMSLSFLPKI